MRVAFSMRRSVLTAAALTTLVITPTAVPRAQQAPAQPAHAPAATGQPPATQPPGSTPAAPPPVMTPLSASTLATHPERYYGDTVTVTAPVDQVLSSLAFSLDQDPTKSTGQDVLVLAPRLSQPVTVNDYITVIGELVKFDAAEVAKKAPDRKIDLPAAAATKYAGKPAIIAEKVITATFVELTRKLPPPMTADDEALDKIMKRVQPAFAAIRGDADRTDMAAVKQHAAILKQSFTEVEQFWKQKGKPEAMKLAGDARLGAENIDRVVSTGKWDEVKTAAGTLQQSCQACHGAYRERFDDGSFRIKAGVIGK